MRTKRKYVIAGLITIFMMSVFLDNKSVSAFSLDRINGQDRYQTAVAVSQEGWKKGAKIVMIASGRDFRDALAAAPLAYHLNAPLLLTETTSLSLVTLEEIRGLQVETIVLLGGGNAISEKIRLVLEENVQAKITRIGGKDHYETAALISKQCDFPDAITTSPYASRNKIPILFTKSNHLPHSIRLVLKGIKSTLVIGGRKAISENVEILLPTQG